MSSAGDYDPMRMLVTVKAYPRPSRSLQETVCIAGITDDSRLVRWYPVTYRQLPRELQFNKYDWVEAMVTKGSKDHRAETFVPDIATIKVIGKTSDWSERCNLVLPLVDSSIEALKQTERSLGLIRPAQIMDFIVEPDDQDWKPRQKVAMSQQNLVTPVPFKPLEKVPFKFYYHFRCDDPACKKGHKLQLVDWEVYQAYRKWRSRAGSQEQLHQMLKEKFLTEFTVDRDTHFYVGTALAQHHYKQYMVIGVFYPPRTRQLSLL